MMMVILVHGGDGCNGDDNAAGQTTCAAKKKGRPHARPIYIIVMFI